VLRHLCPGGNRLFADEAFLDARSASRTTIDVAARTEERVSLHVGANHAFVSGVAHVASHLAQRYGAHLLR
jgi:hypothetical protein